MKPRLRCNSRFCFKKSADYLADSEKSIKFAPEISLDAESAAIAQLVEHFIRNEKVVGSSPTRGSRVEKQTAKDLNVFGCLLFRGSPDMGII